ncbi:MAG: metal-dependent phosphohydrolase [Desulfobulbus sp.]|nr:MAG: metal-dependent phosphohydrolase [Desulfobulbus sp.]
MAEKKVFIAELVEGQQVRDIFLVARKNLAETKAGKPYLALTLMDRTGEIEARIWENAAGFDDHAQVGNYVLTQGVAKSFREQLQLGVVFLEQIRRQDISPADFMPASRRDTAKMQAELSGYISSLQDLALKKLLQKIFSGETLALFSTAPAAKKMHHAYIGGLLEHTLSVTGLADKLALHYPELDRDILLAGALLHDLAKIKEFSFASPPFDYTDQGRLLGHLVLGVDMVRQAAKGIKALSGKQLDQVCHLILSHHGRHDFGAPVLPMTQEALLLHHVDDIDAKMNYTDQLREKIEEPGHHWSEYQRPLERFLFLQPLEPRDETSENRQPAQSSNRGVVKQKRERKSGEKRQQSLF